MAHSNPSKEALGNDLVALETMIDRTSVHYVLELLAQIMREKADHIRENYQDESLARAWISSSSTVQRCADKFNHS